MAEDLSKYYDNIQAEINKRKKLNQDTTELEKYRQAKIDAQNEYKSVGGDPNSVSAGYAMSKYQGTDGQYLNDIVAKNKGGSGGGSAASFASGSSAAAQSPLSRSSSPLSSDISGMIDDFKQAQIDSRIAALDKAKSNALGAYAGAERGINQNAQGIRNTNSVTSQRGALDFAKYLASRGLVNSGTAAQGEISRNVALQGAQSQVESDRGNQLADVANARANIESGYGFDVAGARAGVESQAMEMAIQDAQRQRELALDQDRFNKQFGLQERQFNQNVSQQGADNAFRVSQFEESIRQNNISQSNWMQQFTYQQAQDKIQNMLNKGQLSVQQANTSLAKLRFDADQDPNSLDNKLKQSQLELNAYSKGNAVLNDTIQRLDSMYLTKNPITGAQGRNTNFSDTQLRAAIIGLGLEDNQTDALLLRYGLPIN
jgi:hypothetical protein